MKTYIISFTLMLLLVPRFATAQGNLVVNGGFDADASGWATDSSSGYYDPLGGDPGGCFVLNYSISQTITGLVPGVNYLITGSYKYDGASESTLGVEIDYDILLLEGTATDNNWNTFSFFSTATSSSADLRFVNQTIDQPYSLDNISMETVPEPSAISLFGISVLFLHGRKQQPNT